MSGIAAGGPFNIGTQGAGSTNDANKFVYYVPLPKNFMIAIHDYYTRGDALIKRANAILSHDAFGQGFYLEWAERNQILPDDTYDYSADVQSKLEMAGEWRHMFGFAAFVRPNEAAQDELARQEEHRTLTPEEIAQQSKERSMKRIVEQLGSEILSADKDPSETDGGAVEREHRRINLPFPKRPEDDLRKRKRLVAKEKSMNDGNALVAANSRIEFVQEEIIKRRRTIEEQAEKQVSLMDMLVSIGETKMIDVHSGQFFLEVDEMGRRRNLRWVPKWRTQTGAMGGPGTHMRFIDYDPNVIVYVWPGCMPTDDGIIRTDFAELMRLREMVREAEDNAMDADYQASHPTPFIQQSRAPVKADATELPEEDMYGIDVIAAANSSLFDKNHMNPGEMQTYRRDVRDAVMLEMTVEAAHNTHLQKRVKDMAAGHARATRATRGGLSVADARSSMFEKSGIFHLPGGLQLGGTVIPKPVVTVQDVYNVYQKQLSVALGVPLSYLWGEQAGRSAQTKKPSGQGASSHSASITESMMRTTVMRFRADSSLFFDFLYDSLFRESDTKQLTEQLGNAFKKRQSTDESRESLLNKMRRNYETIKNTAAIDNNLSSLLSEAARLDQMQLELRRIVSLKHRLKLKFVKAPFIEQEQIQQMYELGAVSHTEMVNVLRQNIGLEKIEEKEVARVFDENMRYVEARTAALQPPPEPNSTTETVVKKQGTTVAPVTTSAPASKSSGGGGAKNSSSSAMKPTKTDETETTTTVVRKEPMQKPELSAAEKKKEKKLK